MTESIIKRIESEIEMYKEMKTEFPLNPTWDKKISELKRRLKKYKELEKK